MASPGIAVGIDLGTTYSCIAVLQNGKVDVIANDFGNRTTPSVVAFQDGDNQEVVGKTAASLAPRNPINTIFDAKRLIGRSWNEESVQEDIRNWPFRVFNEAGLPRVRVDHNGTEKVFSPQEISAMVLRKMKAVAEAYLAQPVTQAVITVPAFFTESQRRATKEAGELAGLKVLRLMPEPSAAVLAYSLEKPSAVSRTVLVYDLGGGTFDVSIATVQGQRVRVLGIGGNSHLGGQDFDQRILKFVVQEIAKKTGVDLTGNAKKMRRLLSLCETAKCDLSAIVKTEIDVEAVLGDECSVMLSRAKMEDLCKDLLAKTVDTVKSVLYNAEMKPAAIGEVILVGGSTRMPCVLRTLQDLFPGKEVRKSVNPDEAVAHGAALLAALLSQSAADADLLRGVVLTEVTPLSLGIALQENLYEVVIPRNTPLPARNETSLRSWFNSTGVSLDVFQGERPMADRNKFVGKYIYKGLSCADCSIVVALALDEDGLLNVQVREKAKQEWHGCTIQMQENTSAEVLQNLEDAEKYKEEDERERRRLVALAALRTFAWEKEDLVKHDSEKIVQFQEVKLWVLSCKNAPIEECTKKLDHLKSLVAANTGNTKRPFFLSQEKANRQGKRAKRLKY